MELERGKREAEASGFSDIWDAAYKFSKVYIHTIYYTIEQTYSADKKRHKAHSKKKKKKNQNQGDGGHKEVYAYIYTDKLVNAIVQLLR